MEYCSSCACSLEATGAVVLEKFQCEITQVLTSLRSDALGNLLSEREIGNLSKFYKIAKTKRLGTLFGDIDMKSNISSKYKGKLIFDKNLSGRFLQRQPLKSFSHLVI